MMGVSIFDPHLPSCLYNRIVCRDKYWIMILNFKHVNIVFLKDFKIIALVIIVFLPLLSQPLCTDAPSEVTWYTCSPKTSRL